jgi:hypothetical protein
VARGTEVDGTRFQSDVTRLPMLRR